MSKFILAFLLTFTSLFLYGQQASQPKLVVGVVVDQMRQEYLYRFANHFGEDGFKRLMNEGFVFKNAHFNYVPTYTGPGHASVYTGTTPRVHGIIANDWYDKYAKQMRYCVQDDEVQGVDCEGKIGRRSPKNLKTSTITDELRLFSQNRSKVISLSIKDRSAILPGGHQPNGAYWFDAKSGQFITSTFYRESLPDWLVKFNKKKLAEKYMKKGWETYKPIAAYVESARDDRPYESKELGGLKAVFPYDFSEIDKSKNKNELIKYTPYGNQLTVDLALAALTAEDLGRDEVTDILAVSFSSTDYVGHAFGPYSKEVQDTYIRLDLDLARLMKALDEQVGKGQWTMFLTADHAVSEIPAYMAENGHDTDYVNETDYLKMVNEKLITTFNSAELIENVRNNQIFLNREEIKNKGLDFKEVKAVLANFLVEMEGITAAFDTQEIANYNGDERDIKLMAAGINAHMSGDVIFAQRAGWLGEWHQKNGGTTHGSGYNYDTHVPMLFYGWGIKNGSSVNYHSVTDIAPSVSMLLNIKLPSGCTGQPAAELFD
ncbi:alkaline phosphatase family protein [Reichenbachiella carrageenanivorans]|uniref:Alkaline phosphatase family protein n=1 Tax=Reichenbachiella carrageenanivorans TaxID=2979869 RepID=A0ABY6CZL7_9BACT|nr:alkaline phosphatase PafA [Reichenbachiella carrageenanivorans]UXX78243.1 alkaline phosphatase family protein [Reichenbachiella carrageenanivorans]